MFAGNCIAEWPINVFLAVQFCETGPSTVEWSYCFAYWLCLPEQRCKSASFLVTLPPVFPFSNRNIPRIGMYISETAQPNLLTVHQLLWRSQMVIYLRKLSENFSSFCLFNLLIRTWKNQRQNDVSEEIFNLKRM